jgi:diphthine synthase
MLYLIGLGLNEKSISLEAVEALKKCKKIYLEYYTIDFPYDFENLEKLLDVKIEKLDRKKVESDFLIKEAKNKDICLLVYGSPLFATTHSALLNDAFLNKLEVEIIFNASVFDAVSITGLQMYKFGKILSLPAWKENYKPDSFIKGIMDNFKMGLHSLLLCDIGLDFHEALNQFEQSAKNYSFNIDKLVVCSQLGTKNKKVFYGSLKELRKLKKVALPFCFIIHSQLHFNENEMIERFSF